MGLPAFEATRALQFSFRGTRSWLWDRDRGMVRFVEGDTEVLLDTWDRSGIASRGGEVLPAEDTAKLLESTWSNFINDTFWLYPFGSFDNEGVAREVVLEDGKEALLIRYASGGVTPGDSYLYIVDETGRPTTWKMWVKVLPVPGFTTTWEGWQTLGSGLEVSTRHVGPMGATIDLVDVRGEASFAALVPGPDPFALLVARRGG